MKQLLLPFSIGLGLSSMVCAATINLDFESQTAGSSSVPVGWSFSTTGMNTGSGTQSYATSAASGGSTGSGLGGVLIDGTVSTHSGRLPHTILHNTGSTAFDINQDISGTYDFRHTGGSAYASSAFLFGDVGTAADIDGSSAGQLLEFFHSRGGYGNAPSAMVDGAQANTGSTGPNFSDNTWYRVAFDWTATGSNAGNFSATSTRWNGSSWVAHGSISENAYTFDSNEAHFAFANLYNNDGAGGVTFDNISITGEVVPEPSHVLLSLIGMTCLLIRRRR